jgi:hypothetical protein
MGTSTASTHLTGLARHLFTHRTQSVAYGLVLEGGITRVLGQEEVLMKQRDFLVERGTSHAWAKRPGKHCKVLCVLVDGAIDPQIARHVTVGGHRGAGDLTGRPAPAARFTVRAVRRSGPGR